MIYICITSYCIVCDVIGIKYVCLCILCFLLFVFVYYCMFFFFFFQAEDGIRDLTVTGVQTCALPISHPARPALPRGSDHRRPADDRPDRGVQRRDGPPSATSGERRTTQPRRRRGQDRKSVV